MDRNGAMARICAAAGLALLAMLPAACSSRPPSALSPVADIPPEARAVPLLVGTSRRPSDDPNLMFSGDRTLGLNHAKLVVTIPPTHQAGDIAWSSATPPDPRVSFAVADARYLDQAAFQAALRERIRATGRRQVLVFVHGYNTRFDEAAFRFAQIVNDADAKVIPVLFSWASWGTVAAYPYDRVSAEIARNGLEQLLTRIAADPAVGEVSILAHSMGTWAAFEALRQMAIRGGINRKIRQVMFAAPDMDVDAAAAASQAITGYRPSFTLFVSRDDRALNVSRIFWGSTDRLGSIDPSREPYRTNLQRYNVNVVDLTDVKSDDPLGHGKFAQSPEIVRLLGQRIAQGQQLTGDAAEVTEIAAGATRGTLNVIGNILTAPTRLGDQTGQSGGVLAQPQR